MSTILSSFIAGFVALLVCLINNLFVVNSKMSEIRTDIAVIKNDIGTLYRLERGDFNIER